MVAERRDGTLDLEQGVERRGPAKRERFRERYDLRVIILFVCVCVCVSCVKYQSKSVVRVWLEKLRTYTRKSTEKTHLQIVQHDFLNTLRQIFLPSLS